MTFKITKTFIVYDNGQKDNMDNEVITSNIEAERTKLIEFFKCKTVYFSFTEIGSEENAELSVCQDALNPVNL